MGSRYLVASPKGNACGLALLRTGEGRTIAVSVLPKLWPSAGAPSVQIDLAQDPGSAVLHLTVHEMQTFSLASDSDSALDAAVSALTNLCFVDEDTDELSGPPARRLSPLFQELPPSEAARRRPDRDASSPTTQAERVPLANAFWEGVEEVGASYIVRTPENVPFDEPALLGHQLFQSIPSLERVIRELFVSEAEQALKRRMPDFRTVTEDLPLLRGSLTRDGLRRAASGEMTRLECSFADLDHDHPWQQVIRAAARQVALRDIEDGAGYSRVRRCRRLDRMLHDVTVVRGSELLRHRFDERALGKNRNSSVAARLAVAVMQRDSAAGHATPQKRSIATATGLRLATSRLFEIMLAAGGDASDGFRLVENSERVSLLRRQAASKKPDLLLVRSNNSRQLTIAQAEALIDAKYKTRVAESPGTMDMSDQYQQFAYATTTGKRTVFLFAAPRDSSVSLSPWMEVNVPGLVAEVAVAMVPFPQPGRSWSEQLADGLRVLLPRVAPSPAEASTMPSQTNAPVGVADGPR